MAVTGCGPWGLCRRQQGRPSVSVGFLSKHASKVTLKYRERHVRGGEQTQGRFGPASSHLLRARVQVSATSPGGRVPGRGGEGPVAQGACKARSRHISGCWPSLRPPCSERQGSADGRPLGPCALLPGLSIPGRQRAESPPQQHPLLQRGGPAGQALPAAAPCKGSFPGGPLPAAAPWPL